MADEISEALLTMEANEPHANLYRYAEEYVSDLTYELMGIGDDEDFNELVELVKQAVIHGAQWQKEQFEKNRLKHCNSITNEQAELEQGFIDQHLDKYQRMPTFLDAIEYGMRLQKQQMMEDATDVTVHIEAGNYPYIPQMELYDYDKDVPLAKEGDKYKVVWIKEE